MTPRPAATTGRLVARIEDRERALETFLVEHGERLAQASHALARAFARGGTLIPFATGAAVTDAAHVAVEFMHPVIVGKRALPALAPTNDPTGASTAALLARPEDILLVLCHDAPGAEELAALERARAGGLLTIAMTGDGAAPADYAFVVQGHDSDVAQEVLETAYHVLWELVHVFFEHPGLLEEACITCGDVAVEARVVSVRGATATVEREGTREDIAIELLDGVVSGDTLLCHAGVALEKVPEPEDPSGFLYPFLAGEERDLDAVLADARASTIQKGADVIALRREIDLEAIELCGSAIGDRLRSGGRLLAFGNGGSATDAQDAAADCLARGWPAAALSNDAATVTAVGNDVGFENVFARQLISLARPADVALAISTSGSSPNVVAALEEAHRRGLLTVAITGYDGGRLADLDWLDHIFVARSDYIPRLQEAHATIYHLLLADVEIRS